MIYVDLVAFLTIFLRKLRIFKDFRVFFSIFNHSSYII